MGFLDSVRGALRGVAAARAPRAEQPAPRPPAHETWTVLVGDTLAEIAARHGVPAQEVARLNDLDNPDLLFPGQVLLIPPPA